MLCTIIPVLLIQLVKSQQRKSICICVQDEEGIDVDYAEVDFVRTIDERRVSKLTKPCSHTFFRLKTGNYIVYIRKKGYHTIVRTIKICSSKCLCFQLMSGMCSRIYGYIRNERKEIVKNALVVLYKVIGKFQYEAIRFTQSDIFGFYNFCPVPIGTYIVKAVK